jgi:hypothetical protein
MPTGGARSATLERMSALSPGKTARGTVSSSDHSGHMPEVDTYWLAV